jgi:hypothetical protein
VVARDIQPHVNTLQTALAPSQRAMAVRALAGCRHGSTDAVKGIIFHTAQNDLSPLVRVVSIEQLCKLGYYDSAFMTFLSKACDDPSPDVKAAAKDALMKMTPQK